MKWLCCGKCKKSNTEDVRSLDYSHCLLNEVPTEIFLYERTLEKLYLDSNRILELPKQLFNCDELRILNLSDNEINFLPPVISLLINLQKLDLSKNAVTKIPENIKSCTNLSVLDLSTNPLEKFPESLVNLISLKELYLTDIYLEFLPANFCKLINLRILELRENNLSTLPRTINRLIHLTRLDIGNNDFSDLPEVVSSLHNLTELWVDGNHIKKLHPSIGQLRKIIHFEASNNKITSLPPDIGYWTKIVELSLTNNELCQIPTTIGNLKNLVSLKLDENNIEIIPESIGKLIYLEELMINHNCISYLPGSIGLLRKLQVLIADRNKLSSIPHELGSCTSLSILSVRDNRLTEIPAEIGHLSSLRVLNLIGNQLRYLPMSLLKLDKLSALWLSNNQSQPLVPLQQEVHSETYQAVLTCFMLPQQAVTNNTKPADYKRESSTNITNQVPYRHICFASDSGSVEQPRRLLRAPTPYPKELRNLAKHAKYIHRELQLAQESEETPSFQDPLRVKEAKVSTTTNSFINSHKETKNYPLSDISYSSQGEHSSINLNEIKEDNYDTCDIPLPILAVKSSPVIRKAKNIKTDSQNESIREALPKELLYKSPDSITSMKYRHNENPNPSPIIKPPDDHLKLSSYNSGTQPQYLNNIDCSKCFTVDKINQIMPKLTTYIDDNNRSINYNNCVVQTLEYNIIKEDNTPKIIEIHDDVTNIQSNDYNNKTCDKISNDSNCENNTTDIEENNYSDNKLSENEKPRTFIQDKPSPSQYIVAPTPKRPADIENFYKQQSTSVQINGNNRSFNSTQTNLDHSPNSNTYTDVSPTRENSLIPSPNGTSKWAFGPHKNVTVVQVTLRKKSELGFTICEKQGYGIFIDSIASDGPAINLLSVGDKILEVDGIDFTNINEIHAKYILLSTSTFINMMVSHMN